LCRLSFSSDGEYIQRTTRGAEMPPGEMQIDRGFLQVAMPEQHLNGSQVGTGFEQMRGKAVAQGIVVLLMICIQRRSAIVIIPSMAQTLRWSAICGGRTLPFSW
jgi:hypothetical protein